MTEIFIALVAGTLIGIIFSLLRLPIPAPEAISGIAGILGIYLGSLTYSWIIERFFS